MGMGVGNQGEIDGEKGGERGGRGWKTVWNCFTALDVNSS
jgi:hypothetical protein